MNAVRAALAKLPPGPYRVEWPSEQGGAFTLWGRQGTPPDFTDGWAIPLVASGVDTAIYALADILNAATPAPADDLDVAWAAVEAALPEGWCDLMVYHFDAAEGHHEPAQYGAKTMDPETAREVFGYGDSPAAALRALIAALAETTP